MSEQRIENPGDKYMGNRREKESRRRSLANFVLALLASVTLHAGSGYKIQEDYNARSQETLLDKDRLEDKDKERKKELIKVGLYEDEGDLENELRQLIEDGNIENIDLGYFILRAKYAHSNITKEQLDRAENNLDALVDAIEKE
ncbi:MAG: hypothetical protein COX81_01365, partial [Candidatus Magasanikbacteria bacterium CG_4_10_14_0_2_um_filter_37_12]